MGGVEATIQQKETFYSLNPGNTFGAEQPVATSFRLPTTVDCAGPIWRWRDDLKVNNDEIRFPAVKAARFLDAPSVEDVLLRIANDADVDWRVRLEAHASLAPHRPESVDALIRFATLPSSDSETSDGARMEAVFALSEIGTEEAAEALFSIARNVDSVPEETRAAAAWGLGTGAYPSPDKTMQLLNEPSLLVSTHAAAVMPRELPQHIVHELGVWLTGDDLRAAATAAHLHTERENVDELVSALAAAKESVRRLIVLALGDIPRESLEPALSQLDSASREGVATLRSKDDDWLRQPDTDGILGALKQQMLRR